MTWDEAVAELDMGKLKSLANLMAKRAGLFKRGYTAEGLVVDTLWEAWRAFPRYESGRSAFQTWVVYLLRHTVSWHQRDERRTVPFSQTDERILHYILDPKPTLEALVLRQEDILEAKELVQRIECAIETLSRKRTRRTNLAVFRTYLKLLSESKTVKANQTDVAREMHIAPQTVSVAVKRIADICRRCGLRV